MKKSAGLLLYRKKADLLQVFLVHPGGPFWKKKDLGAWSVPKGEFTEEEDSLSAAIREFKEETGMSISGDFIRLSPVRQKSGKLVEAWAVEADIDPSSVQSNTFDMEWPPRSGKRQSFPEIDKGDWFSLEEAKEKIIPAQLPLLDDLISRLPQ